MSLLSSVVFLYRSFLKEQVWFLYVCMYTYIFFLENKQTESETET